MPQVSLRLLALVALFAATPFAERAFASSGDASFRTASLPLSPVLQAQAPVTLADQIGRLIEMRSAMMNRTAPQPALDCRNPNDVTRRLAALKELDVFARTTVAGLIDAAPSGDVKAVTSETLTPVLMNHKAEMTAALDDLMKLPLLRTQKALAADVARLAEQAARP